MAKIDILNAFLESSHEVIMVLTLIFLKPPNLMSDQPMPLHCLEMNS